MTLIEKGNFEEIEKRITPREFQKCHSNSLRVGMKVCSTILHSTKFWHVKPVLHYTSLASLMHLVERKVLTLLAILAQVIPARGRVEIIVTIPKDNSLLNAK